MDKCTPNTMIYHAKDSLQNAEFVYKETYKGVKRNCSTPNYLVSHVLIANTCVSSLIKRILGQDLKKIDKNMRWCYVLWPQWGHEI